MASSGPGRVIGRNELIRARCDHTTSAFGKMHGFCRVAFALAATTLIYAEPISSRASSQDAGSASFAGSSVRAPQELEWVPSPRSVRMRRMVESLELDSAPEHRRDLASAPLPPAAPPAPLEEETRLDKDWRKQTLAIAALFVTAAAMLQLYIVYVGGNLVTVYKCEAGVRQAALSLKLGCMLNVISQVALASSPQLTEHGAQPKPRAQPEPRTQPEA